MVDARIGPGIKSMTKFKKRKEEQLQQQNSNEFIGLPTVNGQNIRNNSMSERLGKIFKKTKKKRIVKVPTVALGTFDDNSEPTSPTSSQSDSLDENRNSDDSSDRLLLTGNAKIIGSASHPQRAGERILSQKRHLDEIAPFVDANDWIQVQTCHGFLFDQKLPEKAITASIFDLCDAIEQAEQAAIQPAIPMEIEPVIVPTIIFNKLPPKKQYLQCMIDSAIDVVVQSAPIDYSLPATIHIEPQDLTITSSSSTTDADSLRSSTYLHKIKLEHCKVTKKSTARVTPKKKLTDISMVKNLVKLCTDKNATNKNAAAVADGATIASNINETTAVAANKYSDNSSDSGYDETLQDTAQQNHGLARVQRQSVISSMVFN